MQCGSSGSRPAIRRPTSRLRGSATALAQLPQLASANSATCNAFLAEMLKAYRWYLEFRGWRIRMATCAAAAFRCAHRSTWRNGRFQERALATLRLHDRRVRCGQHQRSFRRSTMRTRCLTASGRVEASCTSAHSLSRLVAALANLEFPHGRDARRHRSRRHRAGTIAG